MAILIPGYRKDNENAPKWEIKEVYSDRSCTDHQQEGWDLLTVMSGKNSITGMSYIAYIMARTVE